MVYILETNWSNNPIPKTSAMQYLKGKNTNTTKFEKSLGMPWEQILWMYMCVFQNKQMFFENCIFLLFLCFFKKNLLWTSLVAQELRNRLPMQGTQVQSLGREDPMCRGATKPMCHNYWACALEPTSHNYWSPHP